MAKQVFISVLGVVLGIVVGMAFMMFLHIATTFVYPLPDGVSFTDSSEDNMARMNEWLGTLPTPAWILASVCHGLGCMSGAALAMLISGRRSLTTPIIVGVVFTGCGIMNLSSIPHPSWFPFVDVPIYLALALVAGIVLKRKRDIESSADAPETEN